MKSKVLDNLMYKIEKTNNYDNTKLKEIRYGLESLYLSIFKIIVVIIISFLLKTTKELLLFLLLYGLLRIVAFGAHAKRSIDCWIYSILFFGLIPYLIKTLIINKYIVISISLLLVVLLIIYSPADTQKRPLINKKKKLVFKLLTSIISIIYLIIIILVNNNYVHNLLLFSLFMETILVLPLTYKVLGVPYNNGYLYKMKGGKK